MLFLSVRGFFDYAGRVEQDALLNAACGSGEIHSGNDRIGSED